MTDIRDVGPPSEDLPAAETEQGIRDDLYAMPAADSGQTAASEPGSGDDLEFLPAPGAGQASAADLGIEILLRLAEKGEIDPWDVDIVEVTDRALADLDATDRHDLRLCGRALHCATILLRLKAEAMGAELDEALAPPPAPVDDDWLDFGPLDGDEEVTLDRPDPQILDLALIRRNGLRQPRRRRVTLAELIKELRKMQAEVPEGPKPNAIRRASQAELRARTIGLAHDEDVEGDAKRLAEHLALRFQSESSVPFAKLAADHMEDRRLFLALMFLAHWGVLEVEQPTFYGDITIRRTEAGTPASDGHEAAVA
ncbi:MAG: segregation/condensation protein A [Candidatus Sericytochromatia bacterium]|nr:segregation/condensation protein A [Candidatus Tanganyikabacteria bacterium]